VDFSKICHQKIPLKKLFIQKVVHSKSRQKLKENLRKVDKPRILSQIEQIYAQKVRKDDHSLNNSKMTSEKVTK
jgi:hypothetical protein